MTSALLIPVYNPSELFLETLKDIQANAATRGLPLIVVNDGSTINKEFFQHELMKNAVLLNHAGNLGKGAALKTAFQHLNLNTDIQQVITLDGDFQHRAGDVAGLLAYPGVEKLVIGARQFSASVPFRSYIGNQLTRLVLFLVSGRMLQDTQSGLRRYHRSIFDTVCRIESNRFEFEMDVIMTCLKSRVAVASVSIGTSYIEGNKSSHFNPFFDSMRIYFVLFRYGLSSLAATILDILLFSSMIYSGVNMLHSHFISRTLGGAFNFVTNHKMVFRSKTDIVVTLVKYLTLLYVSGLCSYFIMNLLHNEYGMNFFAAKAVAEVLMFSCNFLIQLIFIF
jgi:glycosyltransferase involved in cell wall biosynthesis